MVVSHERRVVRRVAIVKQISTQKRLFIETLVYRRILES